MGDSGYALQPFLLTPYPVPVRDCERRYNGSLVKTRCLVEQAIGILKRRFACLHGELRYEPERCLQVIIAAVVLHNMARDHGEGPVEFNEDGNDVPNDIVEEIPNAAARQIRDAFAQRHFT